MMFCSLESALVCTGGAGKLRLFDPGVEKKALPPTDSALKGSHATSFFVGSLHGLPGYTCQVGRSGAPRAPGPTGLSEL